MSGSSLVGRALGQAELTTFEICWWTFSMLRGGQGRTLWSKRGDGGWNGGSYLGTGLAVDGGAMRGAEGRKRSGSGAAQKIGTRGTAIFLSRTGAQTQGHSLTHAHTPRTIAGNRSSSSSSPPPPPTKPQHILIHSRPGISIIILSSSSQRVPTSLLASVAAHRLSYWIESYHTHCTSIAGSSSPTHPPYPGDRGRGHQRRHSFAALHRDGQYHHQALWPRSVLHKRGSRIFLLFVSIHLHPSLPTGSGVRTPLCAQSCYPRLDPRPRR